MKKQFFIILILCGLTSSTIVKSQSYYTKNNTETNLTTFTTINGQWHALSPSSNTLGANYYQGINFGFDINSYASLVNGVGTNDLYFGRWSWTWQGWNKIWHSGNLNNLNVDLNAKELFCSKISLSVPGSSEMIDALTIDVGSFGTAENANRSHFFRVRDIGAGNWIPFIIKGNGNVGIGTANPNLARLQIVGNVWAGNENIGYSVHSNSKIEVFGTSQTETSIGFWQAGIASSLIGSKPGDMNFYLTNTYDGSSLGIASKSITLNPNGLVGIGTTSPAYKLDVAGTIRACEVKVDLLNGCDFVFKSDYKLMDLKTLEQFVKTNQHLPEVASEKEMVENGVNMKELQMKLLQKMEEMTLYIIEQNKKIEALEQEIKEIKKK